MEEGAAKGEDVHYRESQAKLAYSLMERKLETYEGIVRTCLMLRSSTRALGRQARRNFRLQGMGCVRVCVCVCVCMCVR